MEKAWKIFRAFLLIVAFMLVAVPVSLYVILSTQWAQRDISRMATHELSALLGTEVSIGHVEIHPFNRLSIHDIYAEDDNGRKALEIDEISVAYELFYLLRTGTLVIDYALIDAPKLDLYKATAASPLNISEIIKALKSDKPSRPQSRYELKVNTVIMRNGQMTFDILDRPERDSVFDPNHIKLDSIFLNAYIPRISNDEYRVEIDRFCFREKTGFILSDLDAAATISTTGSSLDRLTLALPHSFISLAPLALDNNGFAGLEDAFRTTGVNVVISDGSVIYPPDLSSFLPAVAAFKDSIQITLDSRLSADNATIKKLNLHSADRNLTADLVAHIDSLSKGTDAAFSIDDLRLYASAGTTAKILGMLAPTLSQNGHRLSPESLSARLTAEGLVRKAHATMRIAYGENSFSLKADYSTPDSFRTVNLNAMADVDAKDLRIIDRTGKLQSVKTRLDAQGQIAGARTRMTLDLDSTSISYLGRTISPIEATGRIDGKIFGGNISCGDPDLRFNAMFSGELDKKGNSAMGVIEVTNLAPYKLGLCDSFENYNLSLMTQGRFEFTSVDDLTGTLDIRQLAFSDRDDATPDLILDSLTLETFPVDDVPGLKLTSDVINATVNGSYRLSSISDEVRAIIADIYPALFPRESFRNATDIGDNNFSYNVRVEPCEGLCKFLKLPANIIYPIDINGHLSSDFKTMSLNLAAPYLLQGDKLIENTSVTANVDAGNGSADLKAITKMPTKKGPMTINASVKGSPDRFDNRIDWTIDRKIPINGSFDLSAILSRDFADRLNTVVVFNPGTINFGDDVWSIHPSVIDIVPDLITVEHFGLSAGDKSIAINGRLSADEADSVDVSLSKIALLDIFETLEIDKALIGGTATGDFTGRCLLSAEPQIDCDNLHVDSISYNRCVLGDADIRAMWNNEKHSFSLDADVIGFDGLHSRIFGDIFPAGESLDINFDVSHVPVGFLKPFMNAFAADLGGYASGKARLFGTFKYIDLEGDVYADDFRIKIDFTNTWYSTSDSIHIRPGRIKIDNVTIRDINGQTARLDGEVRHIFFKDPSFNFTVSNARDFLSYNVDSRISPDWYGTIYGNGGATVTGEPGVVNIGVNMTTAPRSTFTFVLSDRLDADEYSFITFKDSRAEARRDSLMAIDNVPSIVRHIRERLGNTDSDSPSAYNMDLQIGITPNARITLVMDPVGGDEIKATGSGNLRMTYESLNNDLKMYGTYSLNRGSYNFTLQDIIIKDFTIKEGSSIAFHGDPYSAQLDIVAYYAVNANLSDLDESFLLDKDLNRTNVPVHALLKVKGDMRQPDIDFDLEFPTLTQDTYRKVRSIVSTNDMMNRQIIYLLALNRFYTPDYMASTTKGNELFSVASSTISSQLSSMLGKLSDDWSIAPNLRSDRGDFSDVEVDVALSSRLLNNRLLFNGNFGYRDKTLNTNQFIGDFDVEYLLNPKGSWRLKAYNRYNDQNYYVRTAQTTQGLGIVYKKDFDNLFGFLRRKKRPVKPVELPVDTVPGIVLPDSIAHPADPLLKE